MAYTEMIILATGPAHGGLPAIGSVAENFTRTEDTSFIDYICSTSEAASIRALFGEGAYEKYVEGLLAAQNATGASRAAKTHEPTEQRSRIRQWITRIRQCRASMAAGIDTKLVSDAASYIRGEAEGLHRPWYVYDSSSGPSAPFSSPP
ncbi:hypothetical protein FQN57_006124 [Myotisia sp. PD_48]|nr:hypothetical protein FQN57_006124 [Myotisia sp. PD_48]